MSSDQEYHTWLGEVCESARRSKKPDCTISEKGTLVIRGKKIGNMRKMSLVHIQSELEKDGAIKGDPEWKEVYLKIQVWFSRQWKDWLPPAHLFPEAEPVATVKTAR